MQDKESNVQKIEDVEQIKLQYKKRWEVNLRRGLIELLILMLIKLNTEDAHAYGLIGVIRKMGIPELKAGTIYPLLKRMEDNGLIESVIGGDLESYGQTRRIYTITQIGNDMIKHMVKTDKFYHDIIQSVYKQLKEIKWI